MLKLLFLLNTLMKIYQKYFFNYLKILINNNIKNRLN